VTLTLTSDDIESHIVVNVSSTLTNRPTTIWFVAALCFIVDVRTNGRTGIFIGFIRSSLRRWPKICEVWPRGFRIMRVDRQTHRYKDRHRQTDGQTDKHTHDNTSQPYWGKVIKTRSSLYQSSEKHW